MNTPKTKSSYRLDWRFAKLKSAGKSLCLTPTTSISGEPNSFAKGHNRGMPEPVEFHPSFVPVKKSIRRCELYAKKHRLKLRQKLPAIRHTQVTANATTNAATKLCVNP